jgi:hypothetical protein
MPLNFLEFAASTLAILRRQGGEKSCHPCCHPYPKRSYSSSPFAPLFSHRVWLHAQVLLLGAMLAPSPRTVTAAFRVMGLALERRFTNYYRVPNWATWSAR